MMNGISINESKERLQRVNKATTFNTGDLASLRQRVYSMKGYLVEKVKKSAGVSTPSS